MKRKLKNNCENETQKKHVMTMTLYTSSNEYHYLPTKAAKTITYINIHKHRFNNIKDIMRTKI